MTSKNPTMQIHSMVNRHLYKIKQEIHFRNLESDLCPPLEIKYWWAIPLLNIASMSTDCTFNQKDTVIPAVHISGSEAHCPKKKTENKSECISWLIFFL